MAKEAKQQKDQLEAVTDYVHQREQSQQVEVELKTVRILKSKQFFIKTNQKATFVMIRH